jgi:WD40 repeat protein
LTENPFLFGRSAQCKKEFVGRKEIIDKILSRIRTKQSCSIVAERRLGKTSLLKHIGHDCFRDRLKSKLGEVIVVYMDFELYPDLTAEKFWRVLIEETASQAQSLNMANNIIGLLSKPESTYFSEYRKFALECAKAKTNILFLFDEFEYVPDSDGLDLSFFGKLRGLISTAPIACIIATRKPLSDLDKLASTDSDVRSPFFNFFQSFTLTPFENVEAEALISSSLAETDIVFDSDDLRFLYELSGYHPFFLQMASYYLFEEKRVHSERKNEEIRANARAQFDNQCGTHFDYYWKLSYPAEKNVMRAYALDRPPVLGRSSESIDREMPKEIKSLIDRGLLVKDPYNGELYRLISSSLASRIRVNYKLGKLHYVPKLPQNFLPRSTEFEKLKKALLYTQKEQNSRSNSRKIGIYGMGGVGKSAFAAALAHDEEVGSSFPDGIIWVCLGQQPNLLAEQSKLLRSLGEDQVTIFDTQDGLNRLSQLLKERSCLVILDDVWKMEHLNAFNALGPKCSMLFTTRNLGIVRNSSARECQIDVLSVEESKDLLSLWSGQSSDTLPSEAKEVAKECNNLPLALAMVGAMAKGRPDRWRNILHKLESSNLEKIHAEFPSYPYPNLMRAIEVSVEALNPEEKGHYLELAVFKEDTNFPLAALQVLWDLGEYDTQDRIDLLANRSLVRIEGSMLSLHDLQHDFVVMKADDLKSLHNQFLDAYMKRCMQGWPSGPNDGYFFQNLAYHLSEAGRLEDLKSLLFDFNWIRAKLKACDKVNTVVSDYEIAKPQEDIEIYQLQKAIRFSANVLDKDQSQLPSQLFGRLTGTDSPRIEALLNQALETTSNPWLRSRTPGLISSSRGIGAVVVTPNSRKAITGSSYRAIEVWDLKTGQKDGTLKGHTKGISSVAVSSDGLRAVSGSADHTIKVWDLKTYKEIRTLKGHTDTVFSVAVSLDGQKAISGSNDCTIKVWDLKTYKEIRTLKGHTDSIYSVAIFPDGQRAVSGSDDRTIKVWDLETGKEIRTLKGHTDWISAVAISPDGRRVVSGSWDHTAKVWDLETGQEILTFKGHNHEVSAVAISPDGRRVVSGSWDHTAKVWDLVTGQEILPLKGHIVTIGVSAIAVSLDGRRAVSRSSDGIITIWGADGKERKSFEAHTDLIYSIALTADGRRAISGSSDNTIKVWDLETGLKIRTTVGYIEEISAVFVTPDGQRAVSGSSDGTIKVWDLETCKEIRTLKGHTKEISAVTVAPDGQRAVSVSGDDTIKVWDLGTGKKIRTLKGRTKEFSAVAVTPDGQRAISGSSDGTIKVWDLETCKEIRTFKVHEGIVFAIAVFHDNRTAISGSYDGTIKIWDLETENIITTFSGGSMTAIAVAKDEINIIAGDNEGRVHFLVLENMSKSPRGDKENIGMK